jgi:hypothetical protein
MQGKRNLNIFRNESGSVAIVVALLVTLLMAFAALAIDIGHLGTVKCELQKAADASALAGARALGPYIGTPPAPNWIAATDMATQMLPKNKADGSALGIGTAEAGYWNFTTKTLQPLGITPGADDVPAVQVTITKAAGQNGGPVNLAFASIMGVSTSDVAARSLAFTSPVRETRGKDCFPLATPQSIVDAHWNDDPPYSFEVGSTYHNTDGGQWTSFLTDANDVPTIRDLIDNGSPTPLKIGDQIWIEPGTKAALYSDAAAKIGDTVLIPVVPDDFSTHNHSPIVGFVSFYIEDTNQAEKWIKGHFVKDTLAPGDGPGGEYRGTLVAPRLAF